MSREPETDKKILKKRFEFFIILFCLAAVSAAFLLPPAKSDGRPRLPHLHSLYDLKQIGLSLKQYAADNADFFPPEDNAKGLELIRKLDYLADYDSYICPDTKKQRGKGPLTENSCSYVYFGGFRDDRNPRIPLAFDKPGNHHNFMSVLFLDGSAKRYSTSAAGSCEKIIIFLNWKYQYPEKLFAALLRKARTIDSELNPEPGKRKARIGFPK